MPFNTDGSVTFTAEEFNLFKLALSFMLFAAGEAPEASLDSAIASVNQVVEATFDGEACIPSSLTQN